MEALLLVIVVGGSWAVAVLVILAIVAVVAVVAVVEVIAVVDAGVAVVALLRPLLWLVCCSSFFPFSCRLLGVGGSLVVTMCCCIACCCRSHVTC